MQEMFPIKKSEKGESRRKGSTVMSDSYLGKISDYFHLNNKNNQLEN